MDRRARTSRVAGGGSSATYRWLLAAAVLTVAFAFYLVATVLLRRRPKRLSDLVADGHGRA